LVRALMIVIGDPVTDALGCICKRREQSFLQELPPDRPPKPLNLTQRLGMVRSRSHVLDSLAFEYLLEPGFSAPSGKLPSVVRQDLPWRTPLANGALDHFQHGIRSLLPKQPVANHVSGVIVDDAYQVYRIHSLEVECKDINLPHCIG
jgi:hypothetical protein